MAYLKIEGHAFSGAILLGSGTSYDIKTLYPNLYSKLTNDNFLIAVTSITGMGWNGGLPGGGSSADVGVSVSASAPSLNYDADTGVLTVTSGSLSGNSNIFQGSSAGNVSSTYNGSVSHKVYMIPGKLKTS